MKLLLDENLSRRIVPFLQADYPDSTQIVLANMESASDLDVWRFARENDYVIVTKDSDFYDISLVLGAPPMVIWIKTGNVSKSAITNLLLQNCKQIETQFFSDGVACIELY
jgi:predicted nuclease of predicted toxin-antitoxin system